MEFTLTKRKIILIIIVAAFLLVGGGGYFAWSRGLLDHWLPATYTVSADPSANEPALIAANAIYSPELNAGQAAWESKVCAQMTAQGCLLFKNMYATPVWNAAKSGALPANISFSFVSVAEKLADGSQVWKLASSSALASSVYILVAQDPATHHWLMIRTLFDQEAKARYGG